MKNYDIEVYRRLRAKGHSHSTAMFFAEMHYCMVHGLKDEKAA